MRGSAIRSVVVDLVANLAMSCGYSLSGQLPIAQSKYRNENDHRAAS
jgi:hypothetical protein